MTKTQKIHIPISDTKKQRKKARKVTFFGSEKNQHFCKKADYNSTKILYNAGFDTETECMVRDNELIIHPAKTNFGGKFAEQILSDLITQGYNGKNLLA